MRWRDGHPAHEMQLQHARRGDARGPRRARGTRSCRRTSSGRSSAAGSRSTTRCRILLRDQRALRTTDLNDGLWCNVRDVATCFGARTYGTDDDVVVEVDGRRWRLGPGGVRKVRSRPDLVTDHASPRRAAVGRRRAERPRRRSPPDRPLARGAAPRRRPLRPPPRPALPDRLLIASATGGSMPRARHRTPVASDGPAAVRSMASWRRRL